jgi:threonine aldolase
VQVRTLPGEGGRISPETLQGAVRPENVHFPRSKLLCLENTHNTSGGRVYPLDDFAAVAAAARGLGLKVHLDGARLFNAQAATGIPAREWCEHADTVSVCSSKGLGAPVGSLLAGDGLRDAGYSVDPPETNIVLVQVGEAERFLGALAREGLLATPMSATSVRFCTHLDIGDREVEAAIEAAARITADAVQQ